MDRLNLFAEDVITLKQACDEVPRPAGRKPLHISTVWRWSRKGLRGHILETVRIGDQVLTSRQALHRFLAAVNEETTAA